MTKDEIPAFPYLETGDSGQREGMTLRDYFAAKAMQALLAASIPRVGRYEENTIAYAAMKMADAMLEARK